ncbi:hypothetical protein HDV03_001919 [Kappamyces sp. JEL0829]|nr:hypothetical protein HDV03_001919 [Kappamyces sp. JEL0829]
MKTRFLLRSFAAFFSFVFLLHLISRILFPHSTTVPPDDLFDDRGKELEVKGNANCRFLHVVMTNATAFATRSLYRLQAHTMDDLDACLLFLIDTAPHDTPSQTDKAALGLLLLEKAQHHDIIGHSHEPVLAYLKSAVKKHAKTEWLMLSQDISVYVEWGTLIAKLESLHHQCYSTFRSETGELQEEFGLIVSSTLFDSYSQQHTSRRGNRDWMQELYKFIQTMNIPCTEDEHIRVHADPWANHATSRPLTADTILIGGISRIDSWIRIATRNVYEESSPLMGAFVKAPSWNAKALDSPWIVT